MQTCFVFFFLTEGEKNRHHSCVRERVCVSLSPLPKKSCLTSILTTDFAAAAAAGGIKLQLLWAGTGGREGGVVVSAEEEEKGRKGGLSLSFLSSSTSEPQAPADGARAPRIPNCTAPSKNNIFSQGNLVSKLSPSI